MSATMPKNQKTMILFPNCKINLGLDILRRREDGYHEIDTLMYPVVGLCDILEIVPRAEAGAECVFSGLAVDCPPEKNLCLKAYALVAERYGIGGVCMHLHKVIPFGAGLGGGSSDAAFAIKGLNRVFGLGLADDDMEALAAELGSDTAFFIRNVPQFSRGRGEVLSPAAVSLAGKKIVIVKPPFGVSTAEAYAGVRPCMPERPLAERTAANIDAWRTEVGNDFEPHIFAAHPDLAQIKSQLYDLGALYASMSGSGSAVFGIFDPKTVVPEDVFGDAFVYQGIMS